METHEDDAVTADKEHVAIPLDCLQSGELGTGSALGIVSEPAGRVGLAHPYDGFRGGLVRVDDVDGLLDFAQDHVHMTVVSLLAPYPGQPGLGHAPIEREREREGPTWRMPLSSRSPRSLTKTRSESETRIRSNGSAIWVAAIGSVCDVAERNEERESERARKRVDFAPRCTARTDRRRGHSISAEDAPTEPLPAAAPTRRTLRVVVPRESRLRLGRPVTQQHATRLQLRRHGQVLLRLLRRKSSRESRFARVSHSNPVPLSLAGVSHPRQFLCSPGAQFGKEPPLQRPRLLCQCVQLCSAPLLET